MPTRTPLAAAVLHAATRAGLLAAVVLAVAVAGMTHTAPRGDWMGTPDQARARFAGVPVNVPTWHTATPRDRAGCWPIAARAAHGVPATLHTADRDGVVTRRPFTTTTVDAIAHTPHLYVIGACR